MAKKVAGNSSTQKFTEIVDILDDVVVFTGGNAALVIELTASNFALLSQKEQDGKIYSYASLLNSLAFPIQILVRNKRIDITSYVKALEEAENTTKNSLLGMHIKLYRDFVKEMVQVNVVLHKTFYIVIGYNSLEGGVGGVTKNAKVKTPVQSPSATAAQKTLLQKANSVLSQLGRLGAAARVLQKEELIKLYYDIYNDNLIDVSHITQDLEAPVTKMNQRV